jgi:Icc-related predicted phosphoesterase
VFGQSLTLKSPAEIEDLCSRIRSSGYYPYVCTSKDVEELESDKSKVDQLFDQLIKESLVRWMGMITSRVDQQVTIIMNPGNDDRPCVDEVLKENDRVVYPLEKLVYVDETHPMISCEWTNPSPWNSPRECDEEKLEVMLEREFARVEHCENLICNFHAPPFDTHIDNAPELRKLKPVLSSGGVVLTHVGSTAVRRVLTKYQPLIGLHGHIHESHGEVRLGRTRCFNPGSEYQESLLRFFVIDLNEKGIENYWYFSGR